MWFLLIKKKKKGYDLLTKMLEKNPAKRIKSHEIW